MSFHSERPSSRTHRGSASKTSQDFTFPAAPVPAKTAGPRWVACSALFAIVGYRVGHRRIRIPKPKPGTRSLIVLILRLETSAKTQNGNYQIATPEHRRGIVLRTVPTIMLSRLHEFSQRTSKSTHPLPGARLRFRIKVVTVGKISTHGG